MPNGTIHCASRDLDVRMRLLWYQFKRHTWEPRRTCDCLEAGSCNTGVHLLKTSNELWGGSLNVGCEVIIKEGRSTVPLQRGADRTDSIDRSSRGWYGCGGARGPPAGRKLKRSRSPWSPSSVPRTDGGPTPHLGSELFGSRKDTCGMCRTRETLCKRHMMHMVHDSCGVCSTSEAPLYMTYDANGA